MPASTMAGQSHHLRERIEAFSREMWPRTPLRSYQLDVATQIIDSIERGLGSQFAVVFARQSGKDELLAQISSYLLSEHSRGDGGSIVMVTPTLRPQGMIARRRLLDRLSSPTLAAMGKYRSDGNVVSLGSASCAFLSAHPYAQARGETATLLLGCNEAQDVAPARWDAVFDPMGASNNATQVFSGTVWTSRTLLARQMAYLSELERKDGVKRVFKVNWEEVAEHIPRYGEQVKARIAQFGRDHPFIRSEYLLEEIDSEGQLFGPGRRAQMRGDHPRQRSATPGRQYALLLDVAGADETAAYAPGMDIADSAPPNSRRDATALTVVEADLSGLDDPLVMRPRYRVVDRRLWVGAPHAQLYAEITDLALGVWQARWVVVDATGVGAGLAGFLSQRLPGRVVPFVFTVQSKSQLGWDFLAMVDGGRYKEYAEDGEHETGLFWTQVGACRSQVGDGPGRPLRWGVDEASIHDDLLVSASLTAVLDRQDWRPRIARGR